MPLAFCTERFTIRADAVTVINSTGDHGRQNSVPLFSNALLLCRLLRSRQTSLGLYINLGHQKCDGIFRLPAVIRVGFVDVDVRDTPLAGCHLICIKSHSSDLL